MCIVFIHAIEHHRGHSPRWSFAVQSTHSALEILAGMALAGSSDNFPYMFNKLFKSVLTAEPLVIVLSVSRFWRAFSKPLGDFRIKVLVNQLHHEFTPILRPLCYLNHYHLRSNAESTFSMVKAKFGDSLRSKTDTSMVNESLARILCHNPCCLIQSAYELGIQAKFWRDEPKDECMQPVVADHGMATLVWM
jgi:hypothetical protein